MRLFGGKFLEHLGVRRAAMAETEDEKWWRERAEEALKKQLKLFDIIDGWQRDCEKAEAALRAIIARGNTRSPNSTVRAMQKIAREALWE